MLKVRMESTTEYDRLVNFFIQQGLEYDEDEAIDFSNVIKAWKITQPGDFLIASCMLVKRGEHFVIQGMAVDPVMRKMGLGKILVNKAVTEARKHGAKEIILVARKPGFYRKLEFETVPWEDAPDIFDCADCPQRGVDCFPEVMKLEI